ncbi:MAG: malonyl-CoA decarboxylase [Actinomycetia bacterium]|nr:malonyl-CoA decarboxylase [Actinomycetes bacterium]
MARPILSRLKTNVLDLDWRRITRLASSDADEGDIGEMCVALTSARGQASGVALAGLILERYRQLTDRERTEFFQDLAENFDPDPDEITDAAQRFAADSSAEALKRLSEVVEPPRQELLRRLNRTEGGTAALVSMRSDLLSRLHDNPDLLRIDNDFRHLLSSWFNRGFLVLEPITWATAADILEKIIDYEAVHEIADWADLRRRVQPPDRRCYAFFHPSLPREPLVFVEVALTVGTPDSISGLLDDERQPVAAEDADTAVFYSISNCQVGLRGVSFGNFLIKQVAAELANDMPNLSDFLTLSPAPGFAAWVRNRERSDIGGGLAAELTDLVAQAYWTDDPTALARHGELTRELAAVYFVTAKTPHGTPVDPVARFHLGNGAFLKAIHPQANLSPAGIGLSLGLMVNYHYDLRYIEENHEAYVTDHTVKAAANIIELAAACANEGEQG